MSHHHHDEAKKEALCSVLTEFAATDMCLDPEIISNTDREKLSQLVAAQEEDPAEFLAKFDEFSSDTMFLEKHRGMMEHYIAYCQAYEKDD